MKILEPLGSENIFRFQLAFDTESVADDARRVGPGRHRDVQNPLLSRLHPSVPVRRVPVLHDALPEDGAFGTGNARRHPALLLYSLRRGGIDLVENALELTILAQNPDFSAGLVFATALVSLAKWVLAAISIGIIIVMGVRLVLKMIAAVPRTALDRDRARSNAPVTFADPVSLQAFP